MHRGIIRHFDSIKEGFNQFLIILEIFGKFRSELGKLGNLDLLRPYVVEAAKFKYTFN